MTDALAHERRLAQVPDSEHSDRAEVDVDGFSFAAQMKANKRTAKVFPIMMLSASMRVADESRARELGLDLVEVSPPYDNGELTSLLAANLLYELLCVM